MCCADERVPGGVTGVPSAKPIDGTYLTCELLLGAGH